MCSLYPFFPMLFATFLLLLLLILLVFEQTFYYISVQTAFVISLTALSSNFPLLFALLIFLQVPLLLHQLELLGFGVTFATEPGPCSVGIDVIT